MFPHIDIEEIPFFLNLIFDQFIQADGDLDTSFALDGGDLIDYLIANRYGCGDCGSQFCLWDVDYQLQR